MKSYKLIALTGTTGAGKSEVRAVFEEYGFKVIDADLLAREIMKSPVVQESVKTFFGADLFSGNELNRRLLAFRAFETKKKTALLNSITHPQITPLFLSELERLTKSGADKIVFDAPQLFESKLNLICDCVVSVVARREIRLERVMNRDGLSREEAENRINAQFSDEFFTENSDYVIENNSDPESLRLEAKKIIERILD